MEEQALSEVAAESTFSLIGLLGEADLVVKLVLLVLLIASIWSWAVVAEKTFTIGGARKKAKAFEDAFWGGRADEFEMRPGQAPDNAGAKLFTSISREWRDAKSISLAEHGALVARAERSLRATVDREIARVGNGLGVLATIGSVSAFIGLFGTVWGIMNSFFQIGMQQNSSLAVVAPGIAEALFATAVGLFAAIPAVIAYNRLSNKVNGYEARLQRFADRVHAQISREMESA